MQNIKPVQAQLEIIIHDNGLNSAIATLVNAVEEVIIHEAFAYTEERSAKERIRNW
jgi:hypothetical protein